MAYGYKGRILEVDLTSRSFLTHELGSDEIKFLGGAGLNAYLLYKHGGMEFAALDPGNPLIFGAGPLVGTSFPTSARSVCTAISPLTGIFGDSNCGGLFGVAMKKSGYDHIIIKGKSDCPCVFIIDSDSGCRIQDASELWGKDTLSTEKTIKRQYPKAVVASIGPAGENQVRFAFIATNEHKNSFSRAGMGAVMGSKNLKAIVLIGSKSIDIKREDEMKRLSKSVVQWTKTLAFPRLFRQYGTMMFINMLESKGLLYGENWRKKIEYDDIVPIDGEAYLDAVDSKSHGCYRCPLSCGKHWRIKAGPYKDEEGQKYDVAYIMALGLSLGFRDVSAILHLVNKLNAAGMDINEFSGVMGMVIDAQKQGIITERMTDGLRLDWGNMESIENLIEKTSTRQGFGDILAEGTKQAAKKIGGGADKYALHMKGMHWPAHSAPPFVLAFSLSTRGGDFLKGVPHLLLQPQNLEVANALFGAEKETFVTDSHVAKGRAVWWHENYKMVTDCLGFCFYLGLPLLPHRVLLPQDIADAFHYATGIDMNGSDIQIAAERGYQVERAINTSKGCNKKDDSFTRRPEHDSWAQGIDLDSRGMLDEYYAFRGLSPKGLPTRQRLEELNLVDILVDLDRKQLVETIADPKDYVKLADIVKNPLQKDIGWGFRSAMNDKLRTFFMGYMEKKPQHLRKQFRRMGMKRKLWSTLKMIFRR